MEAEIIGERWAQVPDYPNYKVSDRGKVISLRRSEVYPRGKVYLLRGNYDSQGYYRVKIVDAFGVKRTVKVHRLVCTAFHGPPKPRQVARHLDGDKTNNAAINLAWGSSRDNKWDSIRHKTYVHGERHHSNKLTEADVLEIYASPKPRKLLAENYNVTVAMINHIKQRRKWKHILHDK